MTKTTQIPRHCMICQDVYHNGERMTLKQYKQTYTNKDYTTGICSQETCMNEYLQKYVPNEKLRELIKKDIKNRGW